jgi:PhnB protein
VSNLAVDIADCLELRYRSHDVSVRRQKMSRKRSLVRRINEARQSCLRLPTKPTPNKRKNMSSQIKPIPEGFHTLTAHLVVKGASQAIEFYKKAFGAEELGRLAGPNGNSVMHADLKIGDSHIFLVDEFPEIDCRGPESIGGTPVTIHMYVEDVDAAFDKAVAAGAKVQMPLADMFWGDRYGVVTDPFGHSWSLASHKEDLTREEIAKRAQAACAEAAS